MQHSSFTEIPHNEATIWASSMTSKGGDATDKQKFILHFDANSPCHIVPLLAAKCANCDDYCALSHPYCNRCLMRKSQLELATHKIISNQETGWHLFARKPGLSPNNNQVVVFEQGAIITEFLGELLTMDSFLSRYKDIVYNPLDKTTNIPNLPSVFWLSTQKSSNAIKLAIDCIQYRGPAFYARRVKSPEFANTKFYLSDVAKLSLKATKPILNSDEITVYDVFSNGLLPCEFTTILYPISKVKQSMLETMELVKTNKNKEENNDDEDSA